MVERNDVLRLPVLKHSECGAVEVCDDVLLVVNDSSMQHDFVDVFAEHKNALAVRRLALIIFVLGFARGLLVAGRLALILLCGFLCPSQHTRYASDAED